MLNIVNRIEELPWHPTKRWNRRSLSRISQIVIHQELGDGNIAAVNKYHITPGPQNHLSRDGAPHFAYHYGIEPDGLIITANKLEHVTWHTKRQNTKSIGIMVVGNFDGPGHTGTGSPTNEQFDSLENLLDSLTKIFLNIGNSRVFGHADFGKPACPGNEIMEFIKDYRYEVL